MRARILFIAAAALVLVPLTLVGELAISTQAQGQQAVRKVDMGDYEPVVPWPKPLPDTDLSHDGWTWGSGAGVWAESPDKVWVQQRGEIELPPCANRGRVPAFSTPAGRIPAGAITPASPTRTRCAGTISCSQSIATAGL